MYGFGIVINIDPVLVQIGQFQLRWYSVAIILAVIVATFMASKAFKEKGIASDEVYYLLPWVLIGGMVGARLLHVIDYWSEYMRNPLQILSFQQGGLAIWGALLGGGIALIVYARVRHLPMGRLTDALVPALLTAQIIGRIGCIINGDSPGAVTQLPWAFIYMNPNAMISSDLYGVPTHPYPVYEMLWNGLVLLFLLGIRRRLNRDGALFLSYLALYSVGRFMLSYIRLEEVLFWGLRQAQVIAIVTLVASIAAFIYLYTRRNELEPVEVATANKTGEANEPGEPGQKVT